MLLQRPVHVLGTLCRLQNQRSPSEICGSHDSGAQACSKFIMFSDVLFVSSILLGVLSTHDHGVHGFRGYIAYSPARARARGSMAVPVCVAQLCQFQGKHRVVLVVSLGMSLLVVFRSNCSGILLRMCSREDAANLRCSHFCVGNPLLWCVSFLPNRRFSFIYNYINVSLSLSLSLCCYRML